MRVRDLLIDRYEVLAPVGEGGMGMVFRAWDRVSSQLVALKLLKDAGGHNVERFEREAAILTGLDHPHIVRCLDHGRAPDGQMFLTMEWLAGETLAQLLARRRLSIPECVDLGLRLASGLAVAHARGVVHRDIKPSNILVQDDDVTHVKLLDFGIARVDQRSTALTNTGAVLGTAGYMAPEQARGELSIGPAADVFSLGCVLFECVVGRPAFQGRHAMAILAKLLLEEVPSLAAPEVPGELSKLLDRMLAKAPSERPHDASAVWQALRELDTDNRVSQPSEQAAISTSERNFVSVVAIAPNPGGMIDGRDTTIEEASDADLILDAVHPLGARVNVLLDGTILISLSDVDHPKQQAHRAARCALGARETSRSLALALVTGWGEADDGSPVGEILDRAAELLATAPPLQARPERGLILVDATSRQLLEAGFELVEEDDRVLLRGERRVGIPSLGLLGRPTPFVGRDRELGNIHDLVIEALEDREPAVVVVSGEPGLGKSRLRHELMSTLHGHEIDAQLLTGHGDLMTAGSAFALLGTIFRDALDLGERGSPAAQLEKLEAATSSFVPTAERQRVAEFFGEILRIHFPDHDRRQLRVARQNPQIMADQVSRAYVDFMLGFAAARPRVMMLDDLHWSDAPSIKLIEESMQSLTANRLPCAIVAFARPELDERFPRLWTKLRLHRVMLTPLSRRAATEFAVTALGKAASATEVAAMIERASGNPLFLEELIRSHGSGVGDSLPATILGMLNMRVAALPSEVRQFLRAASVFGEAFWLEGVHDLLGQPPPGELGDPHVAALLADEIIVPRMNGRFANLAEYGFRHGLLREGVYATLTERDRTSAHRRAGHWLAGVGERDPGVLAQHFDLGDEPEHAVGYYVAAAEQTRAASDYPAAIRLAERGLALAVEPTATAELWSLVADASYWSRDFERGVRAAEAALAIARPGSRHDCRALGAMLAAGSFRRGSASESQRWLERLLATEPEPDALSTLGWGFDAAMFYRSVIEPNEALPRHLRRFEILCARAPDDALLQAWLQNVRASFHRLLGRPWIATDHSIAAARCFEQAGYRQILPHAYAIAGLDRFLLGDHVGADEQFARATSLAEAASLQAGVAVHFAANSALMQGQTARALELSARAFAGAEPDSFPRLAAGLVQVDAFIATGELDLADAMLESLEPGASWYPLQHTWFQSTLARLRFLQGRFDDAAQAIAAGQALRAWLGRSHFARRMALELVEVELLLARGETERGRALAAAACEQLLNDAAQIEDAALRSSFLDRIPDHARLLSLARDGNA
jgi:serine/threonine protein kinase/tetratricopeptide (TPR) repeat protein